MQPWADFLTVLSKFENVVIKVSGLFTEADWNDWSYQSFKPYLDHVTNSFSPSRMMFGSDWPVCLLAATYKQTIEIMEEFTSAFSKSDKSDFWANTAIRTYKLNLDQA